jgi:ribosomal protein S18 acetylase RimI-like enzyme
MTAFTVRVYEAANFAGVDALWREAFPTYEPRNWAQNSIPKKLAFQPELFFVATDDSRVIGTIMAGYDGHRGWLYSVAVARDYRRRGVGAALVSETERRLIALGCAKINLQIEGSNAAVSGFYQRLGYAIEPRVAMGKTIER